MNRLFVFLLLLISLPAVGAQVAVQCDQVTTDRTRTRLVLEAEAAVSHQIFTLDGPDRVVIDIDHARLVGKLPEVGLDDPTLIGLRSGLRDADDLRIVLDLKHPVRVKSFLSTPGLADRSRLVIDLVPAGLSVSKGGADREVGAALTRTEGRAPTRKGRARSALIAVDAGHGGADPGAIGPGGTHEKDVTLAIARRLARLIDREPGMRALMIRDGDQFIALRDRVMKARERQADLFISIHADAFDSPDAQGSSVFTLSQGTASSEAANWLANRENSADVIGGVKLADTDDVLANVLFDMTQSATLEHSGEAASAVLSYLNNLGAVHKQGVQRAGFVVLKAPDIPSLLVETAFISNQDEERRLCSGAYQQRVAQAIMAGVRAYFRKYPPQGFLSAAPGLDDDANSPQAPAGDALSALAPGAGEVEALATSIRPAGQASGVARQYVIADGDTLSGIAKRYQVKLSTLRSENDLSEGDLLHVGQVIAIPRGS